MASRSGAARSGHASSTRSRSCSQTPTWDALGISAAAGTSASTTVRNTARSVGVGNCIGSATSAGNTSGGAGTENATKRRCDGTGTSPRCSTSDARPRAARRRQSCSSGSPQPAVTNTLPSTTPRLGTSCAMHQGSTTDVAGRCPSARCPCRWPLWSSTAARSNYRRPPRQRLDRALGVPRASRSAARVVVELVGDAGAGMPDASVSVADSSTRLSGRAGPRQRIIHCAVAPEPLATNAWCARAQHGAATGRERRAERPAGRGRALHFEPPTKPRRRVGAVELEATG